MGAPSGCWGSTLGRAGANRTPASGSQLSRSRRIAQQIKVREALELFRSFYARTVDPDILMEQLGLEPLRDTRFQHLSGGQKQRLFIALALIHDPELLLLDELTTGLDPRAGVMVWERIAGHQPAGENGRPDDPFHGGSRTPLRPCADPGSRGDRSSGSAGNPHRRTFRGSCGQDHHQGRVPFEWFEALPSVDRAEAVKDRVTVSGRSDKLIPDVIGLLIERKLRFYDLYTRQPDLEDVFLHLTGRQIRA
ncbi:MAG: ATP-binding cassette domain-containing protein [Comamonadaceae bacterium]|nr:ATP-binding cassette domain-containing protein [Comamonadaceae bacterium]